MIHRMVGESRSSGNEIKFPKFWLEFLLNLLLKSNPEYNRTVWKPLNQILTHWRTSSFVLLTSYFQRYFWFREDKCLCVLISVSSRSLGGRTRSEFFLFIFSQLFSFLISFRRFSGEEKTENVQRQNLPTRYLHFEKTVSRRSESPRATDRQTITEIENRLFLMNGAEVRRTDG